jgi:hypothetical protein
MAVDLDIDDLNGSATGQDLKHLIQLYRLQKFVKEKSVNLYLLHKEVSIPPTEPKEITLINLNSAQTTQNNKDFSRAHYSLLKKVLQTNPQAFINDEDDNLSHTYSYFDTLQPNTGSDNTPESEDEPKLLIEEEDEPDALEESKRITNSFRKFHTFINSVKMTDQTTDQPTRHHAINIPQFNSHTKPLKQSPYTQMLKEAQSSFKHRRDSSIALDKVFNNKLRTKVDRTYRDM